MLFISLIINCQGRIFYLVKYYDYTDTLNSNNISYRHLSEEELVGLVKSPNLMPLNFCINMNDSIELLAPIEECTVDNFNYIDTWTKLPNNVLSEVIDYLRINEVGIMIEPNMHEVESIEGDTFIPQNTTKVVSSNSMVFSSKNKDISIPYLVDGISNGIQATRFSSFKLLSEEDVVVPIIQCVGNKQHYDDLSLIVGKTLELFQADDDVYIFYVPLEYKADTHNLDILSNPDILYHIVEVRNTCAMNVKALRQALVVLENLGKELGVFLNKKDVFKSKYNKSKSEKAYNTVTFDINGSISLPSFKEILNKYDVDYINMTLVNIMSSDDDNIISSEQTKLLNYLNSINLKPYQKESMSNYISVFTAKDGTIVDKIKNTKSKIDYYNFCRESAKCRLNMLRNHYLTLSDGVNAKTIKTYDSTLYRNSVKVTILEVDR